MKKILFTGGTGLVGRNIVPLLRENYEVVAPTRQELDLKNTTEVENYVRAGKFDVIIHSANPNPVKSAKYDQADTMFEDSMRIFMNFYRLQDMCEKIIYLGSGAELDKTMDMCTIPETEVHRSIPKDVYGCAKYIMNELAAKSKNVYNLRLFACYGPGDHESKFITHCIRCCLEEKTITIRQNCYFDYIHVFDLAKIFTYMIENDLKYHDYNVASGTRYSLVELAEIVKRQMGCSQPIEVLAEGLNKEYTPDITRLEDEMHLKEKFIDIERGIALQIECERKCWDEKESC